MKEFVYNERKPQQLQNKEITERNVLKSLLEQTARLRPPIGYCCELRGQICPRRNVGVSPDSAYDNHNEQRKLFNRKRLLPSTLPLKRTKGFESLKTDKQINVIARRGVSTVLDICTKRIMEVKSKIAG
ncbi:hypothetical protein TNCV_1776981 [Trichonephila clavipes]|nr:hypothetical protein TNCV_1776981 [Trichonephila clavipes]